MAVAALAHRGPEPTRRVAVSARSRAGAPSRGDSGSRAGARTRADRIIARVRAIPEGFVQTYGDIDHHAPRLVGHVLATLEEEDVPWHRVVRADGRAPIGAKQLALLAEEGVPINRHRVDLRRARLPRELGSA